MLKVVSELANRADLSPLKGVAGGCSDLSDQTGMDRVTELARRKPDNLHAKIVATQAGCRADEKLIGCTAVGVLGRTGQSHA